MGRSGRIWTFGVLSVFAALATTPADARGLDFDEGRVRIEVAGACNLYSGKTDRDGDYYLTGSIEYETPVLERLTLGLRFMPAFLYHEHRDKCEGASSETIYGAGLGVTARVYQNKGDRDGLFGEAGAAALWHSRYFERNTSRVNFVTEIGVGYKFPERNWHVGVKFQHASNGGLASRNAGINGLALAVGYTF